MLLLANLYLFVFGPSRTLMGIDVLTTDVYYNRIFSYFEKLITAAKL